MRVKPWFNELVFRLRGASNVANIKDGSIEVEGLRIHYLTAGQTDVGVLLLHVEVMILPPSRTSRVLGLFPNTTECSLPIGRVMGKAINRR